MRLQKQLSQKRGQKVYYKYLVVIPNELVEALSWNDAEELGFETKGRTLVLKPAVRS